MNTSSQFHSIEQDGHVMLPALFTHAECAAIIHELDHALRADESHQAAIARGDTIVAARNILEVYPPSTTLWRKPELVAFLAAVLGDDFGLMRGLYFDKPPGKSWALPWHQDRAIAVKKNRLPGTNFGKPTIKAGVPHVESPLWLSKQIVMIRIHLDAMTEENGPLHVLSGSHHDNAKTDGLPDIRVTAAPGDVLAMRPLLLHRSEETKPGCTLHRRILHLEFASTPTLPDNYEWHTFIPGIP